jgi:glutathionylspermidine synthase
MKRCSIAPRRDWREKVEQLGLVFHSPDHRIYWDESAYYAFSMDEVLLLERTTAELYELCIAAAERVIQKEMWDEFSIPKQYVPLIVNSWERDDLSLYGRFDLRFDGAGVPKLYEFNGDTPTSLLEAAVVQWYWLQELFPEADQFNSIHEKLIERWKLIAAKRDVHFACVDNSDEDFATTVYLEDTARQAGCATQRLFMHQIGWDGRCFVDLSNRPIQRFFKLYPWEWLLREPFSPYLLKSNWTVVEPAWKMILSNKRLLVLLWEMFPGHENLLPAFSSPQSLSSYAKKPVFGREGANITLVAGDNAVTSDGELPVEAGYIYQQLALPPQYDGRFPVIGSWIIGDEPAGMGIREASTPVTGVKSRFVPHVIF